MVCKGGCGECAAAIRLVGKFQPVALLGQLSLQRGIHQRNRHVHIAHFKFRRLEGRVSIL